MALISFKDRHRLEIPHEPGQWVEVRPIAAGEIELFEVTNGMVKVTLDLLAAVVTGWSYDEPVSLDAIKRLDLDTFVWLTGALGDELMKISGIRTADEKKDSGGSSSPTLSPLQTDMPPSPPSSGI